MPASPSQSNQILNTEVKKRSGIENVPVEIEDRHSLEEERVSNENQWNGRIEPDGKRGEDYARE